MDQVRAAAAVTFRCLPGLEQILPRPIPAVQGLPGWFKSLPQKAFSQIDYKEVMTIKKCPPVIDAMGYGFLMPLVADLKVEDGEFSWDYDVPAGSVSNFTQSPIDFHDGAQVAGTPFFEDDRFIVKFNNFWTIQTPPGYSLLFTHPLNRVDLPFTTISGLVDTDAFFDNLINFPARWHDINFSDVLPKGTPVAQCIPVKREIWNSHIEPMPDEAAQRLSQSTAMIATESGIYRRQFRARKR
ncbi:MAG TPA: hypothetical protein VMI47_00810 [Pseudolabrys sp.]|nr:hypothetical protein [Pseudolabrys sp.]